MCLILLAWKARSDLSLVVAANRDEFHARPASQAAFWPDQPSILAGRDLEAQGTWMGVSRGGRFASVTNFRGGRDPSAAESRGALVSRFLEDSATAGDYARSAAANGSRYSGFNLLVADGDELWWASNRAEGARRLEPGGTYALGNNLLDTTEVIEVRERFSSTPSSVEPLFSLLASAKIMAPVYGTRCSTVLLSRTKGRTQYSERTYDEHGNEGATVRHEFRAAR